MRFALTILALLVFLISLPTTAGYLMALRGGLSHYSASFAGSKSVGVWVTKNLTGRELTVINTTVANLTYSEYSERLLPTNRTRSAERLDMSKVCATVDVLLTCHNCTATGYVRVGKVVKEFRVTSSKRAELVFRCVNLSDEVVAIAKPLEGHGNLVATVQLFIKVKHEYVIKAAVASTTITVASLAALTYLLVSHRRWGSIER